MKNHYYKSIINYYYLGVLMGIGFGIMISDLIFKEYDKSIFGASILFLGACLSLIIKYINIRKENLKIKRNTLKSSRKIR